MMRFPSTDDFLEEFGIEPVEMDTSSVLFRYVIKSKSSEIEVDISFSAVMRSFQIVLYVSAKEVAIISSENVESIEFMRNSSGAGIRVIFDICETISEAQILIEPELSCRWWTLRNA
ncbi:hypothetical protein ALP86_102391 [Pseudomonas amygdali pv. mori]|uniref:Uncharacterized protein n=4 Tax=Pseudomonas amygdali TaxID=47877 RepID=A0A3M4US48_PSEA0|nr:hypothetical protein PSYMO_29763 [Pseudomonas amygdali pv. mori str. 301020]RMQ31879.1 hypothetical protein ALQ05_101837 [Pseudomonas amygdali pv. mori]RMR42514.1 hypothetical protein ALP86_102391 [Pseudomonas amygdali pv. mori]RMT13232.1 hypothetical protein ALP52_102273 [Pseudomonas amygdali pv. mori]